MTSEEQCWNVIRSHMTEDEAENVSDCEAINGDDQVTHDDLRNTVELCTPGNVVNDTVDAPNLILTH